MVVSGVGIFFFFSFLGFWFWHVWMEIGEDRLDKVSLLGACHVA